MTWPEPEPGLVLRYSYLWASERDAGREEGVKDRPCAVVMILQGDRVGVVPITHSNPYDPDDAVALTPAIKRRLGLDDALSWVVLAEINTFRWPGPDLRRVGDRGPESAIHGYLPERFILELRARLLGRIKAHRLTIVNRTE